MSTLLTTAFGIYLKYGLTLRLIRLYCWISRAYELSTGNIFPRFNNLPDAVAAAKERSNAGGATDVPLMSDGYHEMPDGSMMKDSEMSSEPATEGEY